MDETRWTSFDLIFFDCDSTLSAIEGIDELARLKGKEWRIGVLTEKAMNGDLDLRDVYGKRLQAIRPTRGQLKAIEERYWDNIVPDTTEVIAALHFLGKQVFIISGGLAEPQAIIRRHRIAMRMARSLPRRKVCCRSCFAGSGWPSPCWWARCAWAPWPGSATAARTGWSG